MRSERGRRGDMSDERDWDGWVDESDVYYEDEEEKSFEDQLQEEIEECILEGGGVLGAGPECVLGGCPYWGGDGICLLAIENYAKEYEEAEESEE